jgi:predicted ATP-dependent endonuclease of OLD family
MVIQKIFIQNYKSFETFDLKFTNDCNIIVGDNEAGKSTLLEAINLALTGQLNGRNISYELTPFLFNKSVVAQYVAKLKAKEAVATPKIVIELYLDDSAELASLKGTNNTKRENAVGISLTIQFNEEYSDEYKAYINDPEKIKTVPTEYFEIKWYSFDHNQITSRSLPIKTTLIDTTSVRLNNGTDYYIQKTIEDILEKKERVELSLLYRKLKESFAEEESIKALNKRLKANKSIISHRDLTVSIDISHKSNWDANLTSYLDDIPFQYIGKGDQNVLKMVLALERKKAKESDVILIEEPENHLSFSTMHMLIEMINEKCIDKQLIMSTHSAFVLNKVGIEKLILVGDNKQILTLKDLPADTQKYFKKLPGYDTLRLVLAKKSILVEGPSDELFVQMAYKKKHGKLPIENGVDVICVKGLSFKRFLDIAKILEKNVVVVTDNDKDLVKVAAKYKDYVCATIKVYYGDDINYPTLEPQIVNCNDLDVLNRVFNTTYADKAKLTVFMANKNNKTECALQLFETAEEIIIPEYIKNAIE